MIISPFMDVFTWGISNIVILISYVFIRDRCVLESPSWDPGPILQRGVYRGDTSRGNDKTIVQIPREKSDPYYKEVCIGATSHEGMIKP